MRTRVGFLALALALLCPSVLSAHDTQTATKLQEWYEGIGAPSVHETFGSYLARAAFFQRGARYEPVAPPSVPEKLRVELSRFECVTFIESSLAVARCGFGGEPTRACFERELILSRYRGGRLSDYASKLHYFDDWIDDNESRKRVANLTLALGGRPVTRSYFHITSRVLPRANVGADVLAELTREVTATESRLSLTSHAVLSREAAPGIVDRLQDGDLVAFVRDRSGLLVHHAGFVYRVRGKPRLLHASSYHGRVVLTSEDVVAYLLRRSDRRGVLVARHLSP